jgi:short-subunit dehydrogenase
MRAHPPIDDGIALVTGASSGIGRAVATRLGARVRVLVLVARRKERLESLAWSLVQQRPELRVQIEPCDLRDSDAARGLVARVEREHGGIDVLVLDAGSGDATLFEASWWDRIAATLELNAISTAALLHAALPRMVERERGGILVMSSALALIPFPGLAAYAATKHFLDGLCESVAAEVRGRGIVVTQACPGPVRTGFEAKAAHRGTPSVPSALMISADACAEQALSAFERGDPLVVCGTRVARAALRTAMQMPRGLLRAVLAPLARWQRGRYARAGEPATKTATTVAGA